MFSLKVIIVVILVSGLIAFLGDRIGHYIGRRKMTLLKLRPRMTATIFTIITGILIALLTIFSLLLISSTARTAFFGIEKLKNELSSYDRLLTQKNSEITNTNSRLEELKKSEEALQAKITSLKTEKYALVTDIDKLKEIVRELLTSLKSVRGGEIFARIGEILITQTISGGTNDAQAEKFLKDLLSQADSILRIRAKVLGQEIPADQRILWLSQDELQKAREFIKNHQGRLAVRVNAGHNAAVGEQVVVHFEIFENSLIFKKGTTILEVKIPVKIEQKELEKKIQEVLLEVREIAQKKGLLPDKRGFIGTVPYEKIFWLVQEIKKSKAATVLLKIKAAGDTSTSGPLELSFRVDNYRGD